MKIKTYNERLENETPVSTTEILMRTPAQTETQLGKKVKWKAVEFIQKAAPAGRPGLNCDL